MVERYVPPLPSIVSQSDWYCLDCGMHRMTEPDIRIHWKASHIEGHDRDAERGVDYVQGSQYLLMRHRYEKWIEEEAARFLADMHEGFGADDFIAEAEIRE